VPLPPPIIKSRRTNELQDRLCGKGFPPRRLYEVAAQPAAPQSQAQQPELTYHNCLVNVRSFLNALGVTKLFRKGEYRKRYHEKKVGGASRP